MRWWISPAGAGLVLVTLRDLFHALWHPTRHGGSSRLVMAAPWRPARRLRAPGRVAGLVGPLAMVTVVSVRAVTVVLGRRFLHTGGPPAHVFAAYAAGHGRDDAQP